jgi:glycosyltransferase involved in cell wall biosynthesis
MIIGQFINSIDFGGAETLVLSLSQKLRGQGHKVKVFAFHNSWIINQCRELGIPYYELGKKFEDCHSIRKLPLFGYKLAKVLKENNIEVLHSHVYGATLRGAMASLIARIPHVATQHDNHSITDKPSRVRWLNLAGMLGTKLAMISYQMESVYTGLGVKWRYCNLVYNGVDLTTFVTRNMFANQKIKRELNISNEDTVFVTVGRLAEVKGFPILLSAIQYMKEQDAPPFKVIIVGDGPDRQKLENLIVKYGIGDVIEMVGERNNVQDYLHCADCFVLPSHNEGLPCSIIEAMFASLPAIVTNVGGNEELVIHNETGFLVEANNACLLAIHMKMFLKANKEFRIGMGKRAFSIAQENFTLSKMASSYLDLYKE